jgi:hypothetical protein
LIKGSICRFKGRNMEITIQFAKKGSACLHTFGM